MPTVSSPAGAQGREMLLDPSLVNSYSIEHETHVSAYSIHLLVEKPTRTAEKSISDNTTEANLMEKKPGKLFWQGMCCLYLYIYLHYGKDITLVWEGNDRHMGPDGGPVMCLWKIRIIQGSLWSVGELGNLEG